MYPTKTNHRQGRLFEQRLSDLLNPNHPLLLLGGLIEWDYLEKEISPCFNEDLGAPAKPVRLIAGIFMLQHMSSLSDEETVKFWVENPYWQLFCGFDYLQWEFPIHFSSLCRWRKKIGEKGLKKILAATLRCALDSEIIKASDMSQVTVDTTVMPKNIAYPTDARLYYKCIESLVRLAKKFRIKLRQTYKFLSKRAWRLCAVYGRARKMKQVLREVKRLKTYLGRVLREVERATCVNKELKQVTRDYLDLIRKIFEQKRQGENKVYSIHEPHVECISKGKAHKKYEFGCKVSIVMTHKRGLILSAEAKQGNPFDGHTLKKALEDAEETSGKPIHRVFADQGYKGHKIVDKEIFLSGRRKLSMHFKKLLRRRQAIEPVIGHMKSDGKLNRNYLRGKIGDSLNAILCGVGHNIRLILRALSPRYC